MASPARGPQHEPTLSRNTTVMLSPQVVSEPHILYLGTPVVLISTVNEDGTHNLAPMSSAFWLG